MVPIQSLTKIALITSTFIIIVSYRSIINRIESGTYISLERTDRVEDRGGMLFNFYHKYDKE
jgi:hypothetical protein